MRRGNIKKVRRKKQYAKMRKHTQKYAKIRKNTKNTKIRKNAQHICKKYAKITVNSSKYY